jgi:hypothetical protein
MNKIVGLEFILFNTRSYLFDNRGITLYGTPSSKTALGGEFRAYYHERIFKVFKVNSRKSTDFLTKSAGFVQFSV